MLSAFAARKAALAQDNKGGTSKTTGIKQDGVEKAKATLFSKIQEKAPKPASSNGAAPRSAKRPSSRVVEFATPRKKKRSSRPSGAAAGSPADVFGQQDDMIIVSPDSDSEDDSEAPDPEVIANVSPDDAPLVPRAWSPSAPAVEDGMPIPAATLPPEILCTYEPVLDQNIFLVEPEELTIGGFVSSGGSCALLVLDEGATACFVGNYYLSIIRGAITMAGTHLRASIHAHRVFAPTSSPLPVIAAVASDGPTMPVPSRLQGILAGDSCVILLQSLTTGVEGLQRICQRFDGMFSPRGPSRLVPGFRDLHVIHEPSRDLEVLSLPPTWSSAMDGVLAANSTVTLVKGPKKCGKSTTVRTLMNKHLEKHRRVAVLECDLGQSEFTPAGMVALNVISRPLFGPPFTHPTIPYRAHFIGETTAKSSPSHYLVAIEALMETYRLDIRMPALEDEDEDEDDERISDHIPLIVNTMGWTKGLGADLLRRLEDLIQPTHILEFQTATSDADWPRATASPPPPDRLYTSKTYQLQPVPSLTADSFTAADHRALSILSYFHAEFPDVAREDESAAFKQRTALTWHTARPLVAQLPYEVECAQAVDAVVLIGAGAEDVIQSEATCVLNGALVGLVSCETGVLDVVAGDDALASTDPTDISYFPCNTPPPPATSHCVGLALVRAVSPGTPRVLQVLTPVSGAQLADARVLVKGSMELPIWGMLDWTDEERVAGIEKDKVPYLQWGKGDGIGAERRRVRRNLMRKAQS
ncbi:hypothetical protein BD626DRAFT_567603 [Schizophyllum amplum]|uniref:Polynucleotide 5'-hydroxyl-kinase GRC3 n=1 Tax=Schizophyllum amplum TaxID=97359 RepID=A0A550CIX4_9AGAR|nr:hypothetical protein BD626DRAFT_567603 [Auriculariopsis ampla]